MVLQGVGDIAQEANIGNRISRAEKNASCFDRVADVLDLCEAQLEFFQLNHHVNVNCGRYLTAGGTAFGRDLHYSVSVNAIWQIWG